MTMPASLGTAATLTVDQLKALHDELGAHDDADLQERYTRLGSVAEVVLSVIRSRLAALLAAPASLTIPGVISTGNEANIRALQEQLQRVANEAGLTGISTSLVQHTPRPRRARR